MDLCRGNKTFTTGLFLSPVMMWHTHIRGGPPLHAVPWVGRVWASYRVKSVSFSSTWLADILYASCFSLFKAIKDIESFELFIFTWELNKVYTVMEDPTSYPGIRPSTIQPQHLYQGSEIWFWLLLKQTLSFEAVAKIGLSLGKLMFFGMQKCILFDLLKFLRLVNYLKLIFM
jgi:hypothetical protein